MAQKCVEACDELILWFGDGEYVEKALELKMLYQPFDKSPGRKVSQFFTRKGKKHQPSQEKDEAKEENTEKNPAEAGRTGGRKPVLVPLISRKSWQRACSRSCGPQEKPLCRTLWIP